jgi:hypothetical protein
MLEVEQNFEIALWPGCGYFPFHNGANNDELRGLEEN